MKLGLLAASLVLVAGGAVGCGDDGGDGGDGGGGDGGGSAADEAASTDDFCAAFQTFEDDLTGMTGQEENLGEILRQAAQKIADVGTPEGIPDDAKEGLQLTLDALLNLPDDATVEDMVGLEAEFSDADKEKTEAFTTYLAETCAQVGDSGDSETDSGGSSDEPSEDSSGGS